MNRSALFLALPLLLAPALAQSPPQKAPAFRLPATDGQTYSLASLAGGPTALVFLNADCPHNPQAVPDLNQLQKQLGRKVRLIGFVNRDLKEARAFRTKLKLGIPLVADPTEKTITAFGGAHSLDLAVISRDGKSVLGLWSGISRDFLGEVQKSLRQGGAKGVSLNLSRFSAERRSGCGF